MELHFYFLLCCILAVTSAQTTRRTTTRATTTRATTKAPNTYSLNNYPNPITDRSECRMPHAPAYVCNPHTYIMSNSDASAIHYEAEEVCDHTDCPCGKNKCSNLCDGYSIGVAIVDKIEGNNKESEVDNWAEELLNDWEFNGQCSAGRVQIVLADGEGFLSTARGSTAAKKLTDKCIESLYDDIEADLAKNDEGRALQRLVNGYSNTLRGKGCKISAGVGGAASTKPHHMVALTAALLGLFVIKSVSL